MRKLISLFLILSLNAYGQSEPITRLKLEGSGTYVPGSSIQVPNNSATKISGSTSRLETGNTNLLSNPSFEATVPSTGWTLTNATSAANTSFKLEGAQSLQVTPTVAGGGIKQSVTLNAASLLGSQGVIEVPVRTSGTDVKVCFLANSVRTYCKNVPAFDSTAAFKTIVTPITFDGTSNGIEVYSTGTSVFIVDEIKIGRGLPLQNVNGAKLVGTVTISGCTSTFNLTSVTFTDFGANTNCVYTTTGSAVADTSFGTTQIPSIKFASLPAGDYSIQVEGSFYQSNTNQNGYLRISDGTNISKETSEFTSSAGGIIVPSINHTISYSTTQSNVTLKLQGASTSSNLSIFANGTLGNSTGSSSRHLTFKVYYFPPESKIYSQASQDTDWQPCTFSTLAWQGLGTVANNLICKRSMGDLLIKGSFTTGTVAASIAQIPLPTNFGTITTSSLLLSNSLVGLTARGYASAPTTSLIFGLIAQPSQTYLNVSNNGNAQYDVPVNGSTVFNSTEKEYISELRVPINEWKNYGVIVGSFADTITTPSSLKRVIHGVDFYTTSPGTACSGTCSLANYYGVSGWITSVVRTGLGDYTLTLNPSYWLDVTKVRCQIKHSDLMFQPKFTIPNSSGVVTINARTNTGSYGGTDVYGTLECTGSIP